MGLDLIPAGRPKPGFEARWSELMQKLYEGDKETDQEAESRFEISILPWADLGAPRVGEDPAADAWVLAQPGRDPSKTDAEVIEEMRGYCALALLRGRCDGLPSFTHAGLYEGIDETSFRGSFLELCEHLLGKELLNIAWTDCMRPEEAIDCGHRLLDAAERAARAGAPPAKPAKRWWQRAPKEQASLEEQLHILREAGRWYVFWGSRGHPIQAWY
jgi:hypothetical protein